MEELSTREKLILAGMDEITSYGLQGFSLRRVAANCGVSCAAPYKHFADKQELFNQMVVYVNEKWLERLKGLLCSEGRVEDQIADIAVDYVTFLCEHPNFRSILMIKETGLDSPIAAQAAGLSVPVKRLFIMLGRKHRLTRAELRERIFVVRSLIYGATIILGADESSSASQFKTLRSAIVSGLEAGA